MKDYRECQRGEGYDCWGKFILPAGLLGVIGYFAGAAFDGAYGAEVDP